MLKPEEIDYIEEIGELNSSPVKLIRTKGGFFCLAGKENPYNQKETALAAGSHPSIIKFQLKKKYGDKFVEFMNKSESETIPFVLDNTEHLSETLKRKGYSLYSIVDGVDYSVVLSRYNNEIAKKDGIIKSDSIDLYPGLSIANVQKATEASKNGFSESLVNAVMASAEALDKEKVNLSSVQEIKVK